MTDKVQQLSDEYLRIWSDGEHDRFNEFYASEYRLRTGSPFGSGREALRQQAEAFRGPFPDVHWAVTEQSLDGDMFVLLYKGEGTHTGELMGLPPTNKHVFLNGASFMRMEDGRVAESWEYFDTAGMMMQLGMVPMG